MSLDPLTAGIDLAKTFVNKFVKDKDLATKLIADAESQEFAGEVSLALGQIEINKIEAASDSLFVAGWRPFCGWACSFGLAYNVVISPFLDIWFVMPEIDPALLYPVLLGMLGLSTSRSFEKSKGVAREN